MVARVRAGRDQLPGGPRRARLAGATPLAASQSRQAAPLIILSYNYSGAYLIQQALAARADLACTVGTGILPLCEAAVATWARIDDRESGPASQLALASVRTLVSTQITVLVTAAGKPRWCELATSPPSAAHAFLQVFPAAKFACIHRSCADVVSDAVRSQPWGLAEPAMRPFAATYPGNSIAAAAAYWAVMTSQMLAFESASPRNAFRLRYEDFRTDADQILAALRSSLDLSEVPADPRLTRDEAAQAALPHPATAAPATTHPDDVLQVPLGLVPTDLRERIDRLQAELGFAPVSWPVP